MNQHEKLRHRHLAFILFCNVIIGDMALIILL